MPYIGNTIRAADDYRLIDDISSSFNGSTTSFALQVSGSAPVPFPKSPQQVLISVNGVIQEPDPTGSSGFNLVGTNIVFSSAPTNGHAFFGIIYATADYLNSGGNFPVGSVGAPSITFVSDENTGIYRKGSGSVAFVADATEIANTDSNGLTISSGDLILGDNRKAKFGAGDDFEIYHNNTNNILSTSNGNIELRHTVGGANEALLKAYPNNTVELYYDSVKKFETLSTGVKASGHVFLDDDNKFIAGTGSDLQVYHDGTNSVIDNNTGDLTISTTGSGDDIFIQSADNISLKVHGSEDGINITGDGAVQLYHDNAEKLATSSTGVTITGKVLATTLEADDNTDISMDGTSSGQLQVGGNGYTGAIALDGSNMNIYHNSSGRGMVFGINETAVAKFDTSGNFLPATNNTFNLGSSSLRWANIFTNDLNLSNEGSSNDVDGTWGDWTIREGESDLFLKNNRSGKKYKFNLTEVS